MKFRNPAPSLWLVFFLTVTPLAGCSYWSKSQASMSAEKLQRIIKQYNIALETHDPTMGSIFVKPDRVADYINDVEEIRKRVTFNKSTLMNVEYFHDGERIKQVYMRPEEGEVFDEAEVTIRYELVISPSNTMKTRIIKQKWESSGNVWYLIPDIDAYFKSGPIP